MESTSIIRHCRAALKARDPAIQLALCAEGGGAVNGGERGANPCRHRPRKRTIQ